MAHHDHSALTVHIAVLIQDFPPETGAGPARVTELAAEWIAQGHQVSVVTAFPNRRLPGQSDGVVPPPYRGRVRMREEWNGIHVYRSWLYTSPRRGFARTLVNNLSFAGSSLAHAMASMPRPDVVIASGPPYFSQFSGALLSALRRVPLVLEIRDLWPDYLAQMGVIKQPLLLQAMFGSERWLLKRAQSIVVVTDSFRQRLVEKGVAPSMLNVIPNGVDTENYFASSERHELAGEPNETPLIGYLGTFGAGQGLAAVLDAARILRERDIPARFAIVGDGPHRPLLEADLQSRPVESVSLHPPIPRTQTRALYNSCDVVLVPHASLPVLGDTIPSKIFEVMACERPLVAAVQGEGARIVAESGAGFLAAPGDATSIADQLQRALCMTQEQHVQMGQRGRAFVRERYDRRALAAQYLEILGRIVG